MRLVVSDQDAGGWAEIISAFGVPWHATPAFKVRRARRVGTES